MIPEILMKMISPCMQRLKEEKNTLYWIPFPIPHIRYKGQSMCHIPAPPDLPHQAKDKTTKIMVDTEDNLLFYHPRKLPDFFKSYMDILTVTFCLVANKK